MTFHKHPEYFSRASLISYAPAIFFAVLLVGVVIHINAPTPFLPIIIGWGVGVALLLVAPVVTLWALRVRRTLYIPVMERTCTNFDVGPYRTSRHPVYVGLLFMFIGFGLVINSLIMMLLALILFVFFTAFVIPEEESELGKQCPEVYLDYKKHVRMWL
jgi:protein-S-isoprenylcysteine O-methyltransferase Ste14